MNGRDRFYYAVTVIGITISILALIGTIVRISREEVHSFQVGPTTTGVEVTFMRDGDY